MTLRPTLLALPALAALIAGCGASTQSASKAAKPATAAAGAAITVTSTEFAFDPTQLRAKAGTLRVTLDNRGKVPHELVVLRSDQATGALKVSGGRVSEKSSVGEVSETAAGKTKSATLTLEPGRYVYVCNIPGHYGDGMRGTLTVR